MIITRPSHCELIQDPRLLIVLPAPGTALGQSKIILVKKLDILVILPASSVYPASGCGVLKVTCRCSMLPKTIWNPQGSRAEVEMMSLSSLPTFSPQTRSPSLLCQNLKRLGRDCATPRGGGGYLLLMAWGAHLCSPSLECLQLPRSSYRTRRCFLFSPGGLFVKMSCVPEEYGVVHNSCILLMLLFCLFSWTGFYLNRLLSNFLKICPSQIT